MALEQDLELLDNYLANRLSEPERVEFEKKVEADPELKKEISFQHSLVEGIRNARAAELKTMFNTIPVPPYVSQGAITTKIIASLLVAGLVASGIYYLISHDEPSEVNVIEQPEQFSDNGIERSESVEDTATTIVTPIITETTDTKENTVPKETTVTQLKKADKSASSPAPVDATLKRERELVKVVSSTFVTSSTEVVTDNSLLNYTFHYAFKNKKLMLYGSFEQSQYQILEFITADEHVFFLNYKGNYYLLDDKNNTPTPLMPIKDPQLLKQLKEFRAR
jgi:hypothetical protein